MAIERRIKSDHREFSYNGDGTLAGVSRTVVYEARDSANVLCDQWTPVPSVVVPHNPATTFAQDEAVANDAIDARLGI